MLKETNALFALAPALVMFWGFMWHYNNDAVAEVWTIDNCVMEKWHDWEEVRGVMPSVPDEEMFRDECWEQMGASLN